MSYLKVLDSRGNRIPIRALGEGYEGAAVGRRMRTWGLGNIGPNAVLSSTLGTLRARSRELARNNPNAEGGIQSFVANLTGTGIVPRWKLHDPELKAEVQQLFADWTEEADANGVCDFYGLQTLLSNSLIESGEALCRFRPRYPGDLLTVPLQLQLLEPDHLDETFESVNPANGNPIRMGIEFDRIGRRVAYWLYRDHPGEQFLGANTTERVRVPVLGPARWCWLPGTALRGGLDRASRRPGVRCGRIRSPSGWGCRWQGLPTRRSRPGGPARGVEAAGAR